MSAHSWFRTFLATTTLTLVGGLSTLSGQERQAQYTRDHDPHNLTTFMREGGWCWFQDPRVIFHNGNLIIGGVQGNGSGDAVVGIYNLKQRQILDRIILHDGFRRDDHNCPVFYARPDGRVIAVYALHHNNRIHYSRVSLSSDCLTWGDEQEFEHAYAQAGNVTYMNLHKQKREGRLYNFYRGIDWNPCFISSTDDGDSWSGATKFIASELAGRQRPYARYASNGEDTIIVAFTDAHPHVYGNSIYFATFRDGKFFRADGSLIKDLQQDGALTPNEAELIFAGGHGPERGRQLSAERSAWTSSIAIDSDGRPHIGYTLYLSNRDHRYRIASWTGTKWVDREVAFGGKCLYENESSYTGLISFDPNDPTTVVISTDVNPTTGHDNGGTHEIYRAQIGVGDDLASIKWQPLTANSPVRNIRPIIVSDDASRAILWLRGDFVSYTNYQLDVVGLVE